MRLILLTAVLLLDTAPALADPTPPKPPKGSPEEVICRREVPTGSLVASRRTCMTRAQWTAQSNTAQSQAQALDERGRTNSCGAQTLGGC